MKTKLTIFTLLAVAMLPSCHHFGQYGKDAEDNMHRYWMKETKTLPIQKPKMITLDSDNPRDFINSDGTGIAIPAERDYDLYISPFAPSKGYVQSKLPAGSKVRCPYTGRMLTLGDRNHIAEKELSY